MNNFDQIFLIIDYYYQMIQINYFVKLSIVSNVCLIISFNNNLNLNHFQY